MDSTLVEHSYHCLGKADKGLLFGRERESPWANRNYGNIDYHCRD